MESAQKLHAALKSGRLNSLTRAVSELAEKMAYQIKPPYTEIVHLRAREERERFAIQFSAKLHLHYSNLRTHDEGLVFTVQFRGEACADSPNPPINELFAAGLVDSFIVYGYGKRWPGRTVPTPDQFARNLEVTSRTLNQILASDFLARIEADL